MECRIKAIRYPVCMADDFDAADSRETEFVYDSADRLTALMQDLGKFVPWLENVVWSVRCGRRVIGYLYSAGAGSYETELIMEDLPLSGLPSDRVCCKYYCADAFEIRAFEKEKGISMPDRPYVKRVMAYEEQLIRDIGEDLFFG